MRGGEKVKEMWREKEELVMNKTPAGY